MSGLLLPLLLLLAVPPAVEAFPFGKQSAVTELTAASLNAFVNSHKPVVILFYAPWCGHCKQFHPEYERFAEAVKGTIRVGAINADEHSSVGQQFGIRGFPTIKYWKMGAKKIAFPVDYQGERSAAALQQAMVNDILPSKVAAVSTAEQLEQTLEKSPLKMVAVLFSAKEKVPPVFSVMALSAKLKQLPFVFSGGNNPQKGIAAQYHVAELPVLAILRYGADAADGSSGPMEIVTYSKKKMAYEPMAKFLLDCVESNCSSSDGGTSVERGKVTSTDYTADETMDTPPRAAAAAASVVQMALPVTPVEYTTKSIPNYCTPTTQKLRGQAPLCVFSTTKRVDLQAAHQAFHSDPLLFFDASADAKAVASYFREIYGVELQTDISDDVVVVLRHSKAQQVRYLALQNIDSTEELQRQLSKILNGEVRLESHAIPAK